MNAGLLSINKAVLSVCCLFFSFFPLLVGAETVTDIILINGQAELVQMDKSGEILQRLIKVPDYFNSNRSHRSLKSASLNKIPIVGKVETHRKTDPEILKEHFLRTDKKADGLATYSCSTNMAVELPYEKNEVFSLSSRYLISHFSSTRSQMIRNKCSYLMLTEQKRGLTSIGILDYSPRRKHYSGYG